jgi:MFS family permease
MQRAVRVALVGLGISVVPLDTAVNVAFPDITGSFGLPIAMIQWVVICYVLTHAGLMLAFGRVGDIWGHGTVFRAGLLWSAIAFLLCGSASSYGWLLFCRFLQGIGAGLVISCAPALVTSLFPETRRTHALGVFTLMFAIGSAAGPFVGGLLVAWIGWPGVFWFRAPIALTALLLLRGLPGRPVQTTRESFDFIGALLLAAGLTSLLLALNAVPRLSGGDYTAPALFAVALAAMVGFVAWESRAARPIVRIDLFRRPGFLLVNAASVLMYLATFSVMLIAPYFLVPQAGLNPIEAGVVLAAGFVAMATTSPGAGWLIARFGASRIAPIGPLLTGIGLVLVGNWRPDTAPALMVAALALHGIGMGLFQVAYMELVISAAAIADRGVAGSLSMLTRTIGVVTGAALLTLLFQSFQRADLAAGVNPAAAFLSAYQTVFWLAGAMALVTSGLVAWSARAPRR